MDKFNLEVKGNMIGVGIAQKGANITQNIYGTVNPEILVTQITQESINQAKEIDDTEKKSLEKKFYFIDDSYETIFNVVCNNLDVKNHGLLHKLHNTISTLCNASYWLLGNGGEGKSTTLIRLAVESVLRGDEAFYMDFESSLLEEKSIRDVLNYIQKNTKQKAHIFIDNPDIKASVVEELFREIVKSDFEFVVILAERQNRYHYLKENNKNAIYIQDQSYLQNSTFLTIPIEIKKEVYRRFYALLGEKNSAVETLIETTINQKGLAYVNATYKIFYELLKEGNKHIRYKFDWLEYKDIAQEYFPSLVDSYKYIALFYYFRIKIPFSFFENLYSKEYHQKDLDAFISYFSDVNRDDNHKEPIVFDIVKQGAFKKHYFMRAKHEVIAELFFDDKEFNNEQFTNVLKDMLESFDIGDDTQLHSLIQLFGNKRIHQDDTRTHQIDFSFVDDILEDKKLVEKFSKNFNLFGSIHLARYWTIDDTREAMRFLEKALANIPDNLHFRTELAKIYQMQKRYNNAEKVLLECVQISSKDLNSRTELAKVYQELYRERREKINLSKAIKVLEECILISEKDLNSRTELAKVYQELYRATKDREYLQKAEERLWESIKIDKNNLNARTELAKIYQMQKRYNNAEKILLECVQISSKDLNSRTELAKVYQELYRETREKINLSKAIKVLEECISISEKDLNSRTELAKVYQELYRATKDREYLQKAEERLLELVEKDKNNLQARTELAKVYQELYRATKDREHLQKAEERLIEYIELDAKGLHPRTELSKVYQELYRATKDRAYLQKAEERLLESIKIDNKQLHPRTELSKVYQELYRVTKDRSYLQKAEERLLESIKIDNKQLHPRTELSKVYQELYRATKDREYLQKAEERLLESIKIDNRQLHPRTELSKVYQELYRATKDREYLQKAEERLFELIKIERYSFYAHAEYVKVCNFYSKPRKALDTIDTFLNQKGLRFVGGNKSRIHQALFNNLFSLCGKFKYFDKAEEYFEKYSDKLDERNIENYHYRLKGRTFNFKSRDVEGIVDKVGYDFIVIDNHKYFKRFVVFVEVGDRVIFDIDFSGNATNIEGLD